PPRQKPTPPISEPPHHANLISAMDPTPPNNPPPHNHWNLTRRRSPIVATAIHDGGLVADHLEPLYAIDRAQRLREEDPFTARFIPEATSSVVVHRSRFELDLNRPLDG